MPRWGIRTVGLAALAVAATLASGADANAAQRYAAPGSTTVTGNCDQANACDLAFALSGAVPNDEVVLLPGTYSSSGGYDAPDGVSVRAAAGAARPVIASSAPGSVALALHGDQTASRLEIRATGSGEGGIQAQAGGVTVDDVLVTANGDGLAFLAGGTVRDAILHSTTAGGSSALFVAGGTVEARNVTAISDASAGAGVVASTGTRSGSAPVINARDVIARGEGPDNDARAQGSGASVTFTSSDYRPGATPTATDAAGNITADPVFVDRAGGDFHQAAGSPTIDTGTTDALVRPVDVDGDPRPLGDEADIGADEFAPPPRALTGDISLLKPTTVTLHGLVNPNSRHTTYHFEYGGSQAYGHATPENILEPADTSLHDVSAPVVGLTSLTTYHWRFVATSPAGVSKGADATFTTPPKLGSCKNVFSGTKADDVLTGSKFGDVMHGFGGDDKLNGLDGADCLFGDTGKDHLSGGDQNDKLSGGPGDDKLDGGAANDGLKGDAGSDDLKGGAGSDTAAGGAGADHIEGGDGNDKLLGDAGDDKLIGGAGLDSMSGGTGDDKLYGLDGKDVMAGGSGDDVLEGAGGNDSLTGGPGDDLLVGGAGSNTYAGGPGNDKVKARNHVPDKIDCGPGKNDVVEGDTTDKVAKNCESVTLFKP